MQYERKTYSSDKKIQTFKFAVDSSQYEDKVEASTILADEPSIKFTSVANERSKGRCFCLGTDLKRKPVISKFAADFTRKLHDYQFSEEVKDQFIDAYEKKMLSVQKLTYKVKQYLGQGDLLAWILRRSAWKRRS